jgi:CheY-like chemotaxis protein
MPVTTRSAVHVEQERSRRILVVDDEEVVRGVVRGALERPGTFLVDVETGEDAIRLLLSEPFDLLIVDKNLPGITGLDVVRRAKASQPRIATLVITGYASRESAEEALALGVDAYLVKPFELTELLARIEEAFQRKTVQVEPPRRTGQRPARRKVMVCDPSPAAAEVLRAGVEMLGHQADVAVDVAQVIRALQKKRVDTLICDLELISKDEASACFLRSALWVCPAVEFVAVAGQRRLEGALEAIHRGATRVIYRPLGTARDVARELTIYLGNAGSAAART